MTEATRAGRLETAAGALGLAAGTMGAVVLLGWAAGVPILTRFGSSLAPMKANSALCVMLAGASLWLRRRPGRTARLGLALALPVLLMGAAVLAEYIAGVDLGVDQLLLRDLQSTTRPGRMAPGTACALVFLGVGLVALDRGGKVVRRASQAATLGTVILALLFTAGYLYGATGLHTLAGFAATALPTALALLMLGVGTVLARPWSGVMRPITADTVSGALARRLLPAVILIPLVLGYLRLVGQHRGLYGTELGTAVYAVASVITLAALTWWTARPLEGLERARREAQDALGEREEDLAITLDSIGDAVIATDLAGAVTRMNPVAEALTGWTAAEARGRPLADVFQLEHEDTGQAVESPAERVRREGAKVGLGNQTILVTRHGARRPVSDSAAPIRDAAGNLRGVVLVFRDMSEKARADEERRLAAQRLQVLADTSRQFAASTRDLRGLLDMIARRLVEVMGEGCTVRMLSDDGLWLDDRLGAAHDIDPDNVAAFRELMLTVPQRVGEGFSGKVAQSGEAVLIPSISTAEIAARVEPRLRPFVEKLGITSMLVVPLRARDRILGVISLHRRGARPPLTDEDLRLAEDLADRAALAVENASLFAALGRRVEELQQAEARLRAVVESAPDAMIIAREDGIIDAVNARTEALFERPRAELQGAPLSLLLPGWTAPPQGIPTELGGVTGAGRALPLEVLVSPLATGEGPRLTVAVRDLGERKRLEALDRHAFELETENRRVMEANRMKSEFLAGMSHELRTPLNAIIGFAKLLEAGKTGPLTPTQTEFLGDILSSARHLLQLINDILDLAKVEAGKLELRLEAVELAVLVAEVRDTLRGLAAEKHLRLETKTDPALPPVRVDARRLKQVLYNYLSNAIKFTPDGGRVELRVAAAPDDTFSIEVEDSGAGIAAADLERLFVEFQQIGDTGRKYPGTGLGLALTRRIIEGMGGRVGARSVLGMGSTFTALLPRAVRDKEGS